MMNGHSGPRTNLVLYRVRSEDHSGASLLGTDVMESSLVSLPSLQSSCLPKVYRQITKRSESNVLKFLKARKHLFFIEKDI